MDDKTKSQMIVTYQDEKDNKESNDWYLAG
jgi:hypothetical protein